MIRPKCLILDYYNTNFLINTIPPAIVTKTAKLKVIYNCAYIIANLSNLFEPVMPETSNKIKKYLNIDSNMWDEIKLVNDIKLNGIAPLFERIK